MTVTKGKLKAKMLEYFREVERTGEPLIVTHRGRAMLEIRPIGPTAKRERPVVHLIVKDPHPAVVIHKNQGFAASHAEGVMPPARSSSSSSHVTSWLPVFSAVAA